jgi:hypothetical protein
VRVLPFPSLSARHTPHLAPPSSRDTRHRRPQVCPATRAKHPKWWPSSTISLPTCTSAFARVLSAACVVFFVSCSAVALLHLFSFDPGTDGASVFILQLRVRGKVCCKIVLSLHAIGCFLILLLLLPSLSSYSSSPSPFPFPSSSSSLTHVQPLLWHSPTRRAHS